MRVLNITGLGLLVILADPQNMSQIDGGCHVGYVSASSASFAATNNRFRGFITADG